MARNRVAAKVHVDSKGAQHFRAVPDVRRVEFHFFDGAADAEGKATVGTKVGIDLSDVPGIGKLGDGVARQAMAHGIAQKVGDEYSGSGDDTNASIESAQAMIDRILAGEWLTEREGGSSRGDTILREAIVLVLSRAGKVMEGDTPEAVANQAKLEEILGDKAKAKSWRNRPDVKAEVERIKIERAQARMEKAQAAAGSADTSAGMDDFA